MKNYLISLCIFLTSCGSSVQVGGLSSTPAVNYPCPTGTNVMKVTVNGSLCNASTMYINMPCVSVTICVSGSLVNCQTVNNILLDTGSFGLRIFSSVVSLSLPNTITGDVAECAEFGSGRTWGPVVQSDVYMTGIGNEPKATVPIQLINSQYEGGDSTLCAGSYVGPSEAGYNGILGVGLWNQDCGSGCTGATPEPTYFACNGSTCSKTTGGACSAAYPSIGYCGTAMPLTSQVSNPIPNISSGPDTNGEVLLLPAVSNGGNISANGCMVIGVNTATGNNTPGAAVNVYQANSSVEMTIRTSSPAVTNNQYSFIDSGSNAIYAPSNLGLTNCSGWYCPGNLTTVNMSLTSINAGAVASSFLVINANGLFNTANNAFNDLTGNITLNPSTDTAIDLGINYFYGRPIWVGVKNTTAVINGITYSTGAGNNLNGYWAY